MTVLVFDQMDQNGPTHYIEPLINHIDNLNITIMVNFFEAKQQLEQTGFEYIIIDFSTKEGQQLLQYTLQKYPKQKIITLSEELLSSTQDCTQCQNKYNKRRLIKPVEPIDIYQTLINFDLTACRYLDHFKNPKILLEDLLEQYDYFTYNKHQQLIEKKSYENDYVIKEFIDLVNSLKKYAIPYKILDEYAIKIY